MRAGCGALMGGDSGSAASGLRHGERQDAGRESGRRRGFIIREVIRRARELRLFSSGGTTVLYGSLGAGWRGDQDVGGGSAASDSIPVRRLFSRITTIWTRASTATI